MHFTNLSVGVAAQRHVHTLKIMEFVCSLKMKNIPKKQPENYQISYKT
ncbi:hypothetical protein QDY71_08140 [Kingella negevensis]|nr:hypothetical protein [Kingella negevensis]MDK4680679.1 hypothetical protein [Kingella negevensis]MDK4681598.1 hypothetical protein [Kingella negevensis]MDK4689796.1 hypothetical protein [Kingella negevensis]MDK4692860.1 hypothetical protein [Kingella negevensis]MDK4697716.1 hypothetical protein [Kingella negevensis]